jgi:hypothetical protein
MVLFFNTLKMNFILSGATFIFLGKFVFCWAGVDLTQFFY